MGGDWRMPTPSDFQELIDSTTKEWTQVKGVNGWKFTGSNGNSIFIPASGQRYASSFNYQGSDSYVWTSSLDTEIPECACALYFSSGDILVDGSSDRKFGYVVRGVRK